MITTPTTRTISDQIVADLSSTLEQSIPLLPKAFVRVLAWSLAGVFVLLFKYANWMFLQLFVAHASAAETTVNGKKIVPLIEWGVLLGVGYPIAAQRAQLSTSVTVKDQTGDLPAGSLLLYDATRIVYETVAAVALDAPTVTVTVRAIGDDSGSDGSGAIGNLPEGAVLSFANTPANVATDATVVEVLVTGTDAENIDAYRKRIIKRVQRRPQGGAYADYQAWGEAVAGIANIYPYAGANPGEVDVYVEATEESSGDPDGIPTGAQITAVREAIEGEEGGLATRRPVGAALNVLPISRLGFALQVSGLDPDTEAVRQAIEQGSDEYLRFREPFIVGLSSNPRTDRITQAAMSGVVVTIAEANGSTVTAVALTPPAHTLLPGQKAKLDGEPDWV